MISGHRLTRLPDDVTCQQAAAIFAKGLTAQMLVHRLRSIATDDVIIVHVAAGGVGTFVCRWAKALGATVIAAVGSVGNRGTAQLSGADYVFAADDQDLPACVHEITEGKGVDVVYDEVGRDNPGRSLGLIRSSGNIVLFDRVGRSLEQVDTSRVLARSAAVVIPAISDHTPDRGTLERSAATVFSALRAGVFGDIPILTYPLSYAADAHVDLERRRTTGPVVLIPNPHEGAYVRQPPRAQPRPFAEASGAVSEIRNPCMPQQSASKRSSTVVRGSFREETAMSTTMTRPVSRQAPGRFPLYFRSIGDVTVLEISLLGAEPAIQEEQTIRLAVIGAIDARTADSLRDTLVQLLRTKRPAHISVDLAGVRSMDASGASTLLRIAIVARQMGCAITVTKPQSHVSETMELTGLLETLDTHTDHTHPSTAGTGADGRTVPAQRSVAVIGAHTHQATAYHRSGHSRSHAA